MKKMDTAKSVTAVTVQVKQKAAPKPAAARKTPAAKPKVTGKPAKPASKTVTKAKPALEKKAAPVAKEKNKKAKLVRDSFTMPEAEYAVLGEVKKLCLKAGIEVKKSELLRIGVAHISTLSLMDLKKSIAALVPLKAGRPKKDK